MKKIKTTVIALIAALSFTACQKDNLSEPVALATDNPLSAEKVIKKNYLVGITDAQGNNVKKFTYNAINQLVEIVDGSNVSQHFYYSSSGQLELIQDVNQNGQIFWERGYKYGQSPDRPKLMQSFSVSPSGVLKLESEVGFVWTNGGKKKKEITKIIATGLVTEVIYTYANGNLSNWEFYDSGLLLQSNSFVKFDNAFTPYKNTPVLNFIPGFETQTNNPQQLIINRMGTIVNENYAITYNNSGFPSEINTSSLYGNTTQLFYTYVKL